MALRTEFLLCCLVALELSALLSFKCLLQHKPLSVRLSLEPHHMVEQLKLEPT